MNHNKQTLLLTTVGIATVLIGMLSANVSAQDNSNTGSGPMIVQNNKMYIISGATLSCVNLKDYTVESKVDLSKLSMKRAEKMAAERNKSYLAHYDKDKDGKVTKDEAGRRWKYLLKKYDKNKNNEVTAEEFTRNKPVSPASYGHAALLIETDTLFMLRNGILFIFDQKTLKLKKELVVEEQKSGSRSASIFGRGRHISTTDSGKTVNIKWGSQ